MRWPDAAAAKRASASLPCDDSMETLIVVCCNFWFTSACSRSSRPGLGRSTTPFCMSAPTGDPQGIKSKTLVSQYCEEGHQLLRQSNISHLNVLAYTFESPRTGSIIVRWSKESQLRGLPTAICHCQNPQPCRSNPLSFPRNFCP